MAAFQNFRSALHGFNREDVVHYIEYLNNVHNAKVSQLNTELQSLREELDALRNTEPAPDRTAELEQANARVAELEQLLADANGQIEQLQNRPRTEGELEAYRRAERAERIANERVAQLYQQASGILSDATVRTDEAAKEVDALVSSVSAQLNQLQAALISSRNTMKDAASAMYAVRIKQD